MKGIRLCVAGAALMGVFTSQPVWACWSDHAAASVRLKSMETMFMVTALRCRTGADNFLDDYNAFIEANRAELSLANAEIRSTMAEGGMGERRALNAYDAMVVGVANHYGSGHERLGCAELKAEARALAGRSQSRGELEAEAGRLVDAPALPGPVCAAPVTLAAAAVPALPASAAVTR